MTRHTRYQGLIIQDHKILLIEHTRLSDSHSYWVIPGGGIESGESENECVIREMKEETNLDVRVEKLLIDEPAPPDGVYKWTKSYICKPIDGIAAPGYEPEPEAAAHYSISAVQWFDLQEESEWGEVCQNPFTYPQLVKVRQLLGYIKI